MILHDTNILTVYNGAVKIQDLSVGTLVYSLNPDNKLPTVSTVKRIDIEQSTGVFEIFFDSGLILNTDIKQEFYTFRGDTVLVSNLKISEAVKAFSASLHKDGHWRVHGWLNNKAKHQYIARMIWEYYNGEIEKGLILHHINFIETDNRLENLELLTVKEHNQVHYPYRKQKGFYKRNHKVDNIVYKDNVDGYFYRLTLDKYNSFIIPDMPIGDRNIYGIICLS